MQFDDELLESLEEVLGQPDRDAAVELLGELFEANLGPGNAFAGRPRDLISKINKTAAHRLLVRDRLLAAACRRLVKKGRAQWDADAGVLVLFDGGTASTATLTEATLTLAPAIKSNPIRAARLGVTAVTQTLFEGAPPSTSIDKFDPGIEVGPYTIVELAGQGGMGTVYKVRRDGRYYALKTVRTSRQSHIAALERELDLLRQLNRADFFPTVRDHLRAENRLFLVMDWVDSPNLHDWMLANPRRLLEVDQATFLYLMTQLVDRLNYLHSWQGQGLLFRDLKPKNILIDEKTHRLRLVDFGISHLAQPERLVRAGTRSYLAPEVLKGQADPRTDVFSLGRVGLFLLFGAKALDDIRPDSTPPELYKRGLSRELVRSCLTLCHPDPQSRPTDAYEAQRLLVRATDRTDATAVADGEVFCSTCGAALLQIGLFCPHCGAASQPAPSSRASRSVALDVEPLRFGRGDPSYRHAKVYERLLQTRASSDLRTLRCLPLIHVEPYEYQRTAATAVLSEMNGRALIADDVGLGKTIEAGLILKEQLLRGFVRNCLIVAPPGVLMDQLKEELLSKFGIEFTTYASSGEGKKGHCGATNLGAFDFVIVSKSMVSRDASIEPLVHRAWDVVVVDECHHFKNHRAKGWKNLRRLSARARSVLLLSATPFSGKPEELWALYSVIDPGVLGATVAGFRRAHLIGRGKDQKPTKQLRIQTKRMTIRRRRKDIGGGIAFPRRDAVRVSIAMDHKQRQLFSRITKELSAGANGLVKATALQQLASSFESLREGKLCARLETGTRSRLRELADEQHPKVRALLDRVVPNLPPKEKVLVFTRFRASQRSLLRGLQSSGHIVEGLEGARPRERIARVRRFREDPSLRFLVCGEGAGEGLNLQFCSVLVNFDLPWNPMRIEQRIGRIQRLGQRRRRVSVVNLVLAGTFEARVLEVLEQKLRIFKLFMGETEQILGELLSDEGRTFEAWIAECILADGTANESKFRQMERELTRVARVVQDREKTDSARTHDWLGISGPTSASAARRPMAAPLDLASLGEL